MYQDYYELLDIDRSLPAWAYMKKIHDARTKFEGEYKGELPDQVMSAIAVFSQPEGKADYQQLLAMADAEKVEINAGDVERLKSVAGFTHFAFELNEDGTHRVARHPIELPPVHQEDAKTVPNLKIHRPDTSGVVDAPPPDRAAQQASQTFQGTDKFGRVNGHVPPIVVGKHVYTLSTSTDEYLQQVVDLGDCYQLTWQEPDGRVWSQLDHLGPVFGAEIYKVGVTYQHVIFTNTRTQERTTEGFYTINAPINSFTMSGSGIYCHFPWYAKYMPIKGGVPAIEYKWNRANHSMPMPPIEYFGRNQWSAPVRDAFITYIKDLYYWGQCCMRGWNGPLDEMKRIALGDARIVLSTQGVKPRLLRKHGL